ncbi:thioredoxin fold domain-containing protein [Helicobacter trogontum]|nr:thioredoxin fold domain-containing protein [Helicobacter trogontum]
MQQEKVMDYRTYAIFYICLLCFGVLGSLYANNGETAMVKQKVANVNIDDNLDSIFLDSKSIQLGDKPTMIVFGKDDCYHCSILSASLIGNDVIQGYVTLNFLPYYINLSDKKRHAIPYLNLSGLSSLDTARLYKLESLPLIVFVDTDGKEIMRMAGFPGEKRIIHLLEFIYNDVWKNYKTPKDRVAGFLEYEEDLTKQDK